MFTNYLKCSRMSALKFDIDVWKLLRVFENRVRVEITRLLLQFEWMSLSEITGKLASDYGWKMTLPGVLKHMKELEDAGIIRHESGIFAEKPDARKTLYMLEGKERVQKVLQQLEDNVANLLVAGVIFSKTAELARKVQGRSDRLIGEERKLLESMLAKCESEKVVSHLTEDEKKKIKLWRMMMTIM